MSRKSREGFRVWTAVTVFVQRDGERHPWNKRFRGQAVTVQALDFDDALRKGEHEFARELAKRHKIKNGGE